MKAAALLLALALMPAIAGAEEQLSLAIDAVFEDIDPGSEPGCAAGVIHRGEYIHSRGYGLANLEHGIPITARTVFRTGSLSKQFTAMAIAILAERGELDLDAEVHSYLPELMEYDERVTLRQMIHHIAGMGDYDHPAIGRKADGSEFRWGNEDYMTIGEFYQAVAQADLIHAPGTRYEYSNLGYFLLGQVVERVTGTTLRAFAAEQIFGPLGMSSSLFNDNTNRIVPHRADGYRRMADGGHEIYMTNLSWVGDGGVYTSLDDFIRWDQNFYDNRLGDGGSALIDLVTTPHPDTIEPAEDGRFRNVNYAFGLRVDETNGERQIGHGGSWVGFTSLYQRYPDLALSVIVMCNALDVHAAERGARIGTLAVEAIRSP